MMSSLHSIDPPRGKTLPGPPDQVVTAARLPSCTSEPLSSALSRHKPPAFAGQRSMLRLPYEVNPIDRAVGRSWSRQRRALETIGNYAHVLVEYRFGVWSFWLGYSVASVLLARWC